MKGYEYGSPQNSIFGTCTYWPILPVLQRHSTMLTISRFNIYVPGVYPRGWIKGFISHPPKLPRIGTGQHKCNKFTITVANVIRLNSVSHK